MKRLTIGLLALSCCSAGLANGYVPPPVNYFDGFYLGVGVGMDHTYADAKALSQETWRLSDQGLATYPVTLTADLGDISGAIDAFIGWGKTFGDNTNGYFGIEVFGRYVPTHMSAKHVAQMSVSSSTSITSTTQAELSNDFSFGGDLRLGYLITPKIMIYGLVGLDMGDFDYKISHNATLSGAPQSINYSGETDSWQYGFMPGVGIEAILSDNVSVRAQYTYTYFGDGDDVKAESSITGTTPISSTLSGQASSIQRGLFTVDLTYRFRGV